MGVEERSGAQNNGKLIFKFDISSASLFPLLHCIAHNNRLEIVFVSLLGSERKTFPQSAAGENSSEGNPRDERES